MLNGSNKLLRRKNCEKIKKGITSKSGLLLFIVYLQNKKIKI